jgi:hypothetical protein
MFTLLSEQHKKYMMRKYRLRLLSAIALLGSIVFFVSIIALFPSYLILKIDRDNVLAADSATSLQINQKNSKGFVKTLNDIKQISSLVKIDDTSILPALTLVMNDRPSGVRITSANYTRGVGAPSTIVFGGIASTRTSLINFSNQLKKETMFASVNLPIGDLTKESNAPFSLTVSGQF